MMSLAEATAAITTIATCAAATPHDRDGRNNGYVEWPNESSLQAPN